MNPTRREFLYDATVASVAAMAAGHVGSLAAAQAGDSPWRSRIGLELYTVRDLMETDYVGVLEKVAAIGYKELNKSGAFLVPGFAKFVVIKKPATKERSGINPFTKEPTIFKAKPARKIVRARPVKAAKDAVL